MSAADRTQSICCQALAFTASVASCSSVCSWACFESRPWAPWIAAIQSSRGASERPPLWSAAAANTRALPWLAAIAAAVAAAVAAAAAAAADSAAAGASDDGQAAPGAPVTPGAASPVLPTPCASVSGGGAPAGPGHGLCISPPELWISRPELWSSPRELWISPQELGPSAARRPAWPRWPSRIPSCLRSSTSFSCFGLGDQGSFRVRVGVGVRVIVWGCT